MKPESTSCGAPTEEDFPARLVRVSRLERFVARGVLSLWFPAALVVCAYLLGGHVLTLPSPASDNVRLTSAVATIRGPEPRDRWVALHVLYEGCRCSARVLDHLLARGADPGTTERIVLVGTGESTDGDAGSAARIEAAGFEVEPMSAEALETRYGIQAAPLLVVSDPAGRLRYVGGYTDRKQSAVIRDREVIDDLRRGRRVEPLPVFGCAVSQRLDHTVDPLGLRR